MKSRVSVDPTEEGFLRKRNVAFVAFGANMKNRRRAIERAVLTLAKADGVRLKKVSSLYATEPVGGPKQSEFLNGVLQVETTLAPDALMRLLLLIEKRLGRVRRIKWGPRVIDLDLLAYDRLRLRGPHLTIPHPRYHQRRFVLEPFSEIAPSYRHPKLGRQNRSLLAKLTGVGQRVTMIGQWKRTRFSLFRRKNNPKSPSSR